MPSTPSCDAEALIFPIVLRGNSCPPGLSGGRPCQNKHLRRIQSTDALASKFNRGGESSELPKNSYRRRWKRRFLNIKNATDKPRIGAAGLLELANLLEGSPSFFFDDDLTYILG
jgi:hypothetical protein